MVIFDCGFWIEQRREVGGRGIGGGQARQGKAGAITAP